MRLLWPCVCSVCREGTGALAGMTEEERVCATKRLEAMELCLPRFDMEPLAQLAITHRGRLLAVDDPAVGYLCQAGCPPRCACKYPPKMGQATTDVPMITYLESCGRGLGLGTVYTAMCHGTLHPVAWSIMGGAET